MSDTLARDPEKKKSVSCEVFYVLKLSSVLLHH